MPMCAPHTHMHACACTPPAHTHACAQKCVSICTCTHLCTHARTYESTIKFMYACACLRILTHVHVCTTTYIQAHAHKCTCMDMQMHISSICLHACATQMNLWFVYLLLAQWQALDCPITTFVRHL